MPETLMDAIRELEPLLKAESDGAEQARRMSPKVMEALTEAGVFRAWVPRAYGGLELEPLASLDVFERLAEVDPATGWVVSNCCFISTIFRNFPETTVREIVSNHRAITAGSFVGNGTAKAVDGGYVVSGNWTFGSACHYTTDLAASAMLVDDAGPVMSPAGPTILGVHLPAGSYEIEDTWHTLGLRATGSHNFAVKDHFVAEDHTFVLGMPVQNAAFSGPLYAYGFWIDSCRIATVALGIAKGALAEFLELAQQKTPSYMAAVLSDRSVIQERVARARALIEGGRASIRTAMADVWPTAQDGAPVQGAAGISMGLASSFAMDCAAQAMDLLYECAGSSGFRDEQPFQKRFRDVQVLRGNAVSSWQRYESLGKMMFGQPSDWLLHNL